ncbi:MAG: hypothetical protein P4N60_00490 [Verrucomicrobiae bacterium]|nr:hypothetical protein [Verrucomicrobiae bacterium]
MSGQAKIPKSEDILNDIQSHWDSTTKTNRLVFELVKPIMDESLRKLPSESKKAFSLNDILLVCDLFCYKNRITGSNWPKVQFRHESADFDRALTWANLFNDARDAMIRALPIIQRRYKVLCKSPRQFIKFWYFQQLYFEYGRKRIEHDVESGSNIGDWKGESLDPHRDFIEFFWTEKEQNVADAIKSDGFSVVARTIQKARDELRKMHSPLKSPKKGGHRK